jgi:hypothetical protein
MFICAAPISDSAVVKSQCGKHTLTSVHVLINGQSCFMPRSQSLNAFLAYYIAQFNFPSHGAPQTLI